MFDGALRMLMDRATRWKAMRPCRDGIIPHGARKEVVLDRTKLRMRGRFLWLALCLACAVGAATAGDADKRLLVHYTFEEGEAQSAKKVSQVVDHTSHKNNGTVYGAKYARTEKGYVMTFGGRKSFVKCADQRRVNFGKGDFTIAFQVKLDSFKSGMIMAKKGTTPESRGWDIAYDQASRSVAFTVSDGAKRESLGAPVADLHWRHLALVRQGKRLTLYLNGQPAVSEERDLFGTDIGNSKSFLFLGRAIGPFMTFHGQMDEVFIYGKALTAEEIAAATRALPAPSAADAAKGAAALKALPPLAKAPVKITDPLVLHYTFDADTGDRAKDSSAYGNDGKIVNGEYIAELDGRKGVMRLNGKDAWINCGAADTLQSQGDMSFEMWVRKNGPMTQWATIFGDNPLYNYLFQVAGYQSLVLYLRTEDTPYGVEAIALPVDRDILSDKWAHIAIVVEYPRCRVYHDGRLMQDAYMPFPAIARNRQGTKYLGGRKGACTPLDLDEFRLYQRALSAVEVAMHARGEDAPDGGDVELAVEPNWYENVVALRLSCKGYDLKGHAAELGLLHSDYAPAAPATKVPLTQTVGTRGRYVAEVRLPLDAWQGKVVDAVARIVAPDGRTFKKVYAHKSLKKPDWVHTTEGYSDDVLPPWTPVETTTKADGSVAVDVWGRTYLFGESPFLNQVETGGAPLLRAPITLAGRADGKAVAWGNAQYQLAAHSRKDAKLTQTRGGDALALRVNTTLEYDGFTLFDCEVKAQRNTSLEELTLNIPLDSRYATLMTGAFVYPPKLKPRIPMAESFGGAVQGDMAFRFSPSIWVGNEKGGLTWHAESDEDWRYADNLKAIELLPSGDVTTFRAHFVNVPTQLKKGETLTYRFALLATPVKPMLRDPWDLRIVRSEPYGKDLDLPTRFEPDGRPTLQAMADAGVRHLFTNVNDIWPWPMPVHEQFSLALHRMFNAVHASGLRAHDYMIHQRVPVNVPEFDGHGRNMARQPMRWYVQNGPAAKGATRPGPLTVDYGANSQGAVMHCAQSLALQDAYIHSLAQRLDTFGDDGIYLDGSCAAPPCQNREHGCGYVRKDGTVAPTYPVFGAREFMRRIYTVVKTRRPEGVVDLHQSFYFFPCSMAYSDVYWTGEHWWHLKHTGAEHIPDELPLARYRAEFMGYPFGLAANTLAYRLGPQIKVAAISLLHDVPVRPSSGGHKALDMKIAKYDSYFGAMIRIWKLRDDFGMKDAEKLFYWENQDVVAVSPENCHATLFTHPQNGVVAFVANLRRDTQPVELAFNMGRLNLNGKKLETINALTGEPLLLGNDGKLTVKLGSMEWAYIWLRPKEVAAP